MTTGGPTGPTGAGGQAPGNGTGRDSTAAGSHPSAVSPATQVDHSQRVPRRRVMIVEDDTLVGIGLKAQLDRLGHDVVGQASTAPEAMTMFRDRQPDIVLMDIRLDGTDGIDLAGQLLAIRRVPMIIVSAFSDKGKIDRASDVGVFGYLIKPVSGESLAAQIEVAARRFAEHEQLVREKEQLAQSLENRKLVEKAKGIFMKRLSLDEPEAHRRLQQESQKRRISIVELAKKIIESEQLLGG
jgi:AmiR/NasT family two-component response regulator